MERLNRRHGYLRMSKTYYKAIVISTTRNLHTGRYVWYRHRHRWMKQNITQRSKPSHTVKRVFTRTSRYKFSISDAGKMNIHRRMKLNPYLTLHKLA